VVGSVDWCCGIGIFVFSLFGFLFCAWVGLRRFAVDLCG